MGRFCMNSGAFTRVRAKRRRRKRPSSFCFAAIAALACILLYCVLPIWMSFFLFGAAAAVIIIIPCLRY